MARVHRVPITTYGDNYNLYSMHFWAVAFSQDWGWDIIDSYNANASPARVKGDPITDDLWGGAYYNQIGNNSWFVVEQVNPEPGFLPMQIKFQASGNTLFYDPSGIDYGYDGANRYTCTRFAPWGGWNFDDAAPDFTDPDKATGNLASEQAVTPQSGRHYLIIGDDYFLLIVYSLDSRNWLNVPFFVGRYAGLTPGQHTPDHPCYWYYGNDQDGQIFEGYWVNEQTSWFLNTDEYFSVSNNFVAICPDENGDLKRWIIQCPPLGYFMKGAAAYNEFDAGQPTMDLIEVPVYGKHSVNHPLSNDNRIIGYHKYVWLGHHIGVGAPLKNKLYMPGSQEKVVIVSEWDGVSPFLA